MSEDFELEADRLAVATYGAGEPALFVHGFASDKSIWEQVCRGLGDVFASYAVDLPGCGESPAPRRFRYTLERFADVLTDFIILKDLRKLTLVGASLGATVILVALLRNRDELGSRVRSLCLIGAAAYPQEFPFEVDLLRTPLLGRLALGLPFFVKALPITVLGRSLSDLPLPPQFSQHYARKNVRAAMLKTARLLNTERFARYKPRLNTIDYPALLIWGRKDKVVPLRFGKRLARDLPNARLVIIDRCGHNPHAEYPDQVIAALKEFALDIADNRADDAVATG